MNQLGDAILVMIFLHWFGFPWSLGFVVVMAALGFPVWALLLWVGFACTWAVVRAVQMERRFQREDREQAAREGRVL